MTCCSRPSSKGCAGTSPFFSMEDITARQLWVGNIPYWLTEEAALHELSLFGVKPLKLVLRYRDAGEPWLVLFGQDMSMCRLQWSAIHVQSHPAEFIQEKSFKRTHPSQIFQEKHPNEITLIMLLSFQETCIAQPRTASALLHSLRLSTKRMLRAGV